MEAKKYAKASTLFHDEFTGITRAAISENIMESDIYAVYIYYCNFANDRPIPEEYVSVCPNKPEGFPMGAMLVEQRQRLVPEPGALHLTRASDLLELELPPPDLSFYRSSP